MRMTIKKGDNVLVITGKDAGKTGKVLEVFPDKNRVLVDGVNVVTKHKKARNQNEQSGKIQQNAAIDASNVMVVCPSCGKATRVHHKEINGKKVRVCKCGVSLDKEYVKSTKKDAKKAKDDKKSAPAKEPAKETKAAKPETKPAEKKVEAKKPAAKKPAAKAEVKTAEKKETAKKAPAKAAPKAATKPAAKAASTQKSTPAKKAIKKAPSKKA